MIKNKSPSKVYDNAYIEDGGIRMDLIHLRSGIAKSFSEECLGRFRQQKIQ